MRAPLLKLLAAAAVSLLAGACAPPEAGDPCQGTGYRCNEPPHGALECRNGTWVYVACRGPAGCTRQGSQISCDVSQAQPGDSCASSMEGAGVCSAAGTALYVCRSGAFEQASICRTCGVSGDQVVCQP